MPGVFWLIVFVVIPAYAVLAIAMGRVNFLTSRCGLEPGTGTWLRLPEAFSGAVPGGEYWPAVRNTLVFVGISLLLCFPIGYPVAYYVARHAKRTKTLLIVLFVIPFWVSGLPQCWPGSACTHRVAMSTTSCTWGSRIRRTGSTATPTR